MTKYRFVGADASDEDREEKAIEEASQMCPCGSQLAGILLGIFFGISADIVVQRDHVTLLFIAFGSAFATLGSQLENPLAVNRHNLLIFAIMVFVAGEAFSMFICISSGGIGAICLLSAISSSTVNYTRPIWLLLLPVINSWLLRVGGGGGGRMHSDSAKGKDKDMA